MTTYDSYPYDSYLPIARLMAVVHSNEMLSEGQLSNITGIDRVEIRRLVDEGKMDIIENPPRGHSGLHMLRAVQASV